MQGRVIEVRRDGDPSADLKVLIVGSIHGDEPAGIKVVRRLRQLVTHRTRGIELFTIETVNPDGLARGTRKNARGVDLNRNYPFRFDPALSGGYDSGPYGGSEPETKAVMRLARHVRFDLSIWYHQPWGVTLVPCGRARPIAALYARLSGLPARTDCGRSYPGSAIGWLAHRTGTAAFVAELPAYSPRRAEVTRHARAAIRVARQTLRRDGPGLATRGGAPAEEP